MRHPTALRASDAGTDHYNYNFQNMIVHLLTIGDEILIGQTIDTNSAWMGQQLNLIGARVDRIVSLSDEQEAITDGLRHSLERADVILITGGLGPTKDDITKRTLADFFGSGMSFHEATWERILRYFKKLGRETTPAHREQCYMPDSAIILTNKMGTAPGMWFEYEGKVVVSMPGVPYEMKYLMEAEVIPRLQQKFPGEAIAHRTILTVGEGESRIAARLELLENKLPPHIKLAYLPNLGQVRLRLTGRGTDADLLDRDLDSAREELIGLIPELVFGYDMDLLEGVVGSMLRENGLRFATAESCTGGLIASQITSVPGASDYFVGSVVAYANVVKVHSLGVSERTLRQYGAVSEQTVREMVSGVLSALNADVAVAVSGIAGPGGGTPDKPVGTIWLAAGNDQRIVTRLLTLGRDRERNVRYASTQALNLVRTFLLKTY